MDNPSSFYALVFRTRHIVRWGLMRNSYSENVQEHSHMVAVLAHALAVIGNEIYGKNVDPALAAESALFHDASEIFTGDLPTPVKYLNSDITTSYKQVESLAADKLLALLPDELKGAYAPLLHEDNEEIRAVVKAADKLSAYIKCLEELKAGNMEFTSAEKQIREILETSPLPEVSYFMKNFIPSFKLTLDELTL